MGATDIDLHDITAISTGRLEKTGAAYSLVLLSPENVGQILALEAIALASLPQAERAYLAMKDRAFFESHFAAGNDVLGVIHDGRLIAQSIVVNPTADHPETGLAENARIDTPIDKATVLQGVAVDPAYRGNRLMEAMVDAWMVQAEKQGRTEARAAVATGNEASWSVFVKKGMSIETTGISPYTASEVFILRGRLSGDFNSKTNARPQAAAVQRAAQPSRSRPGL